MIVREIKQDPEGVLKTFDWFNDYDDTRSWALFSFPEIVERLDEGHKIWWEARTKIYGKIG